MFSTNWIRIKKNWIKKSVFFIFTFDNKKGVAHAWGCRWEIGTVDGTAEKLANKKNWMGKFRQRNLVGNNIGRILKMIKKIWAQLKAGGVISIYFLSSKLWSLMVLHPQLWTLIFFPLKVQRFESTTTEIRTTEISKTSIQNTKHEETLKNLPFDLFWKEYYVGWCEHFFEIKSQNWWTWTPGFWRIRFFFQCDREKS